LHDLRQHSREPDEEFLMPVRIVSADERLSAANNKS
jgi:hypothetical protein